MAEHSTAALYRAVRRALIYQGTELWADRVFNMQAPANAVRPYVVIVLVSSIESSWTQTPDAMIALSILCVTDDMVSSLSGAARIQYFLNDSGYFDNNLPAYQPPAKVDGGTDWWISSATHMQALHMVENVQGQRQIYHDGGKYQFRMERK